MLLISLLFFGCSSPTEDGNKEIIDVTVPNSTTIWLQQQTDTSCQWSNAKGESVHIEIYKGEAYLGVYAAETENDGSYTRTTALGNWGIGTDYRLKVIDDKDNFGWSDYFTIESSTPGSITITYPDAATVWQEYQIDTYCDWEDATGDSVYIEIYQGSIYKGLYHEWTDNDGHCTHNGALEDWGTGTDFRLKVIDANSDYGWSEFFTIQAASGQIQILYPLSTTIWQEFQIDTYCDWANATGDSVYIEIHKGTVNLDIYHEWTDNDGHCTHNGALDDWGTGTDFRLKIIDAVGNSGWSDYFTIVSGSPNQIDVIYPEATTIWIEFQTNTSCDWLYASGDSVCVDIYQGATYRGLWHDWTDNDGHTSRNGALDDWGSGTDFRLKVIDAAGNSGWSEYFTIEAVLPDQIYVTYPLATTTWVEYQINTDCDWTNASGDSVFIEIYQGSVLKGIWHDWTNNDGHCTRDEALEDWGTGTDFRLKVIDADFNSGWSEYFEIEELTDPIVVIYPDASTVWQEYQEDTYCDWENATGSTVYIEIYNGNTYLDIYHDLTDNDGHCSRNEPLGNWGIGDQFRLKVIDANNNSGWSEYFTIE